MMASGLIVVPANALFNAVYVQSASSAMKAHSTVLILLVRDVSYIMAFVSVVHAKSVEMNSA